MKRSVTLGWFSAAALAALAGACQPATAGESQVTQTKTTTGTEKVMKTETEWKQSLTPEQYYVLRKKGTERAFTGKYHDSHEDAVYVCAGCGQELFDSEHKFDSGTGWPSYYQPIKKEAVETEDDSSFFMRRTEVHCSRCGGHLGHVFEDGPKPTGLRYCINSAALEQKPKKPKTPSK